MAREASFWDKNNHLPNVSEIKAESSSIVESPLKNLGISKVDTRGQENMLSRNNTLQSLLNHEQRAYSTSNVSLKPHKQVLCLQ